MHLFIQKKTHKKDLKKGNIMTQIINDLIKRLTSKAKELLWEEIHRFQKWLHEYMKA